MHRAWVATRPKSLRARSTSMNVLRILLGVSQQLRLQLRIVDGVVPRGRDPAIAATAQAAMRLTNASAMNHHRNIAELAEIHVGED